MLKTDQTQIYMWDGHTIISAQPSGQGHRQRSPVPVQGWNTTYKTGIRGKGEGSADAGGSMARR